MAEKRGGLVGRVGRRLVVEYQRSGVWAEVPGISSFSIGVGEAPTDTTSAFEGSFAVIGEAPIGDVTFTLASYIPNHQAWIDIDNALDNGDSLGWRITTPEREVLATTPNGTTAAIAKDATAVTFAKQPDAWTNKTIQRGMALVVGTTYYTIASISDDDTATVAINRADAPGSAVSASVYKVVLPSLRWTFQAGIKQAGSTEGGVDTAIGGTLVVTPDSRISLPTIVAN